MRVRPNSKMTKCNYIVEVYTENRWEWTGAQFTSTCIQKCRVYKVSKNSASIMNNIMGRKEETCMHNLQAK
jgi:hypothetical protein